MGQEAEFGAYLLFPRDGEEPLFDISQRDPTRPPPPDQVKLKDEVLLFVGEILRADLAEETQNKYITQAQNICRNGCVKQGPDPKGRLREIKKLKSIFIRDAIGNRIQAGLRKRIIWAFGLLVASCLIALALKFGYSVSVIHNHELLANYCFVWCGAMAALIVLDSIAPIIADFDEYEALSRTLAQPEVRAFATGFMAIALAIGFKSEALTISLKKFSTTDVDSSTPVALFVGFMAGLITSELAQSLVSKVKKWLS